LCRFPVHPEVFVLDWQRRPGLGGDPLGVREGADQWNQKDSLVASGVCPWEHPERTGESLVPRDDDSGVDPEIYSDDFQPQQHSGAGRIT
jgi:hypothetical protein